MKGSSLVEHDSFHGVLGIAFNGNKNELHSIFANVFLSFGISMCFNTWSFEMVDNNALIWMALLNLNLNLNVVIVGLFTSSEHRGTHCT